MELGNGESQSSWRAFVAGLWRRGLVGVEFVVSDDHPGLKAAIQEVCPRPSGSAATCISSGTRSIIRLSAAQGR
nr:transposase [Mesorhizobium abyssinicae]